MRRTKNQIELILMELKKLISNLINPIKPTNDNQIIQEITNFASENVDIAQAISKIIIQKSLEEQDSDNKLLLLYAIDSMIKMIGMEYLEIFSTSNDLFNIFCDAYRVSDEENKIKLFKLFYSWKHYISPDILDGLKSKLGLGKLKEILMKERPDIIEKYDKYNEDIEKKRRELQKQEERLQQNFSQNQPDGFHVNKTNNYSNSNMLNNNISSNLNKNISNNSSSNSLISSTSITNIYSHHNGNNGSSINSINSTTNSIILNCVNNVTSSNSNNPPKNFNKISNLNNQNNIGYYPNNSNNLNNLNPTINNIVANPILLGKSNLNQSLLPSITSNKEKNKDSDYLFSSGSSYNSDDENFSKLGRKRKPVPLENEKEIQVMKDIPIKKRKVDNIPNDPNSNNLSSQAEKNINQRLNNLSNSTMISPTGNNLSNLAANLNNFNLGNIGASHPSGNLIGGNVQNNMNGIPINLNNPPFNMMNNTNNSQNTNFPRVNNLIPFQQFIYPNVANMNNLNNMAVNSLNYINPHLNQIGNRPNMNQMPSSQGVPSRQPFPIGTMTNQLQQNNILFPSNQPIPNMLGNNPNLSLINPNFPPLGVMGRNLNSNLIESGISQHIDQSQFQNSGINSLNIFINKSNIPLDDKLPFFSAISKWFNESMQEDNPLDDVFRTNKKFKSIYDILKIKDFSEKPYKDLFDRILNSLYGNIRNVCSVCGFRTSQYTKFVEHLDIHFHINYIKKNSQKREMHRRECNSKNSWIKNADNNLEKSSNLTLKKSENNNHLSTLNAVLYYLTDSEIQMASNKNKFGSSEGENNESLIFPIQNKDIKCIYCNGEFKKKYFTKYHFWFYINANKLNYHELKMLQQNAYISNDFKLDEKNEDEQMILIHNTCVDEFVNLIIMTTKNIS